MSYYVKASNGKGHGIHSPFVFDFVRNVLNDHRHFYAYEQIEGLRSRLSSDQQLIHVDDFGAGSGSTRSNKRSIASITRNAAKPAKLAQLLFRIVNYYQYQNILELGTSLGISTSYLAAGNGNASVLTCEGSSSVAEVALKNFNDLGIDNVRLLIGNFDDLLPRVTGEGAQQFDLVFLDGNHRYEPTLKYFNQLKTCISPSGMLIFDDIHWSPEMELAWDEIRKHPSVRCSIDLFFLGIVLFSDDFKVKQDYTIRF